MAPVQLNPSQLAALARAAQAALAEAQETGRLPANARFAVRVDGGPGGPALRAVLEDTRRMLVANGYRIAWTIRHPGTPPTKAPGRCRPKLSPEADALLDAAYEIIAPYAAGLLRAEAAVDKALFRRHAEALASRLRRRFRAPA